MESKYLNSFVLKNLEKHIRESIYRNIDNIADKELRDKLLIALSFLDGDFNEIYTIIHKYSAFNSILTEIENYGSLTYGGHYIQSPFIDSLTTTRKSSELKCNIVLANEQYNRTFTEILQILSIDENACIVGGAVRDMIQNITPKDFDFVSSLPYETLEYLFSSKGFTVDNTGKVFSVLRVTKKGYTVEIANFRKDGTYVDGRKPTAIEIGNFEEDANRRDFSVNSLFYSIKFKTLIDPTGNALYDIINKKLRFNGKAKDRINEDYLRLFRAYRFIGKGYEATPSTLKALRNYFKIAIEKTSHERIRLEIEKMVNLS